MADRSSIRSVIGTGGVGSGIVFHLREGRDLQRDESRTARHGDERDFCKLHIILHYVAVLGRELGWRGRVHPISAVGDDAPGHELRAQMRRSGMDCRHVAVRPQRSTLFSVCYQFPDGSGGNITSDDSACADVSVKDVQAATALLRTSRGRSLVLAVPEVPLAARRALLAQGRRCQAMTFASFASSEVVRAWSLGMFAQADVVALNMDEAAQLAGPMLEGRSRSPSRAIARATARRILAVNPGATVFITDGRHGAFGIDADGTTFLPSLPVKAVNTAGAGDAFVAGLLLAQIQGLPLLGTGSASGMRLARLLAAMSTTSADTINFDVGLRTLRAFAGRHGERAVMDALA